MSKVNRKCLYCGEEYYVCRSCTNIYSWKNSCCTSDCYSKMIADLNKVTEPIILDECDHIIGKGKLLSGKEIDIVGIDSKKKFIDCGDGITRLKSEFSSVTMYK